MKTLVVVAAGAADRPVAELGGRTPLEAAATPVMDRLAREGRTGHVSPGAPGARPEEGGFALALFGLDPREHGDIGGVLDAAAFDIPVGSLDQVFRLALVTADRETVFDSTAGHISREEAALLLGALADACPDEDLAFIPGAGWRNVLLWRGARDVRVTTVPPTEVVGRSLRAALPKGTGIGRLLAVIERSSEVLPPHDVNEMRRDLGENPATLVWPWGPGVSLPLPAFRERTGQSAACVAVHPSVVGAARLQGIPVRTVEGATGLPDSNLRAKADAALALLETHDVVFLHVDGLAAASHARDFVTKVQTLERLDGYVLGTAVRHLEQMPGSRLLFVAGEAVSVETGRHLEDPVPFVLFEPGKRWPGREAFTEVGVRENGIEVNRSHELLDFVLHL
jgi:2,3-bisphosphoglycerate-independent phosphoglycerate mutase